MQLPGLKPIILAASLAFAGTGLVAAQQPAAPQPAAEAQAAPAQAQPVAPPQAVPAVSPGSDAAAPVAAAAPKPVDPTLNPDGTPVLQATPGQGQPSAGFVGLQEQVTPNGREAFWFHNWILMPIITAISIFVLGLLLWVMVRYRRAANPNPSKTSHNTLIEIVWTLVPVIILVVIAVPSIRLLAHQFKPAPANAVTIKAIGNQWYWTHEYPDHGGFSVTSNMLKEQGEVGQGQRFRTDADGPRLLAVDNRIVLPVGTPIRLITTANDVIHSWAMPAFWIKLDAIPGRLNETSFTIEKPGLYFGQCSELCGARHAYMPIAVEAVPPAQFAAWVRAKGGKMPDEGQPAVQAPAPGGDAADDTATPANGTGPVENATAEAIETTQSAEGIAGGSGRTDN